MKTNCLDEKRLIQYLQWHAHHRKAFPPEWWKDVGATSPEVASAWLRDLQKRNLIQVDPDTKQFRVTEHGLQLMTINANGDEPIDIDDDEPDSTSTA